MATARQREHVPEAGAEHPQRGRPLRAAWPGLLLATALLTPFLGKAFTIDDTVFMREAEHVLGDPLHPSAFPMVWSGAPWPLRLSQFVASGPGMAWLLVPAAVAGGSERVAHLLQLLLLVIAVYEVAALALRLGFDERVARLSTLLLVSTPAVLGMAGTAMPDVPAMTFGALGMERLYAWRQEGHLRQAVTAALALALAPLFRIHLVLLLGLAPFVLFAGTGRSRLRRSLPVIVAPVLTCTILRLTQDPLGGATDLARAAAAFSALSHVRANVISFGVHWMLALPLGLAWILSRGARFWHTWSPWLAMAGATAALGAGGEIAWLWLGPVAGLGIAVVADIVLDAARRRGAEIVLALWLVLALPVVVYLHFPSKYLLASAPAAAILSATGVLAAPRPRAIGIGAGLVAAGALLGVLVLRADAAFGDLGRRAAAELIAPHVAAHERVWFSGHWGFQWYAERAGATCLTAPPPHPVSGDLVVRDFATSDVPIEAFSGQELLTTLTDDSSGGRIVSAAAGAGFYSNGWGYLPWAWGRGEIDRYELWRVR